MARPLVYAARNNDYHSRTEYRGGDDRKPFAAEYAQAVHYSDAGGDKEKAEIVDKKIGHTLDIAKFYNSGFESRRESDHTDYARWQRHAREPYDEFAEGEEGEQYATLN